MAYIGNTVQNQGFSPAVDYYNGDGTTVTFTLSRPVASVAQLTAVIENVIQNPATAFTVSGNSITFTSAPPAGTNNIWVEYTSLVTTYAAISQDPSVIGDITATGGYLAEGDFGNSYIDGTIVDYVTGMARITTGPIDDMTFYHGGTASRSEMMTLYHAGGAKIYGTTALTIPVGTTAQRPGTPTFGMVRANTTTGYPEWYDPGSSSWVAFAVIPDYSVEYLIVAGGGGGSSGGGGAGGLLSGTTTVTPTTAYSLVIGGGGSGVNVSSTSGTNGSNSTGFSLTTIGGGKGGPIGDTGGANGAGSGGSGGGGGAWSGGLTNGGSGTSGQGYAGGSNGGITSGPYPTGGGGGAGAAGQNAVDSTTAGTGGIGVVWPSGSGTYYAGGGGGCVYAGSGAAGGSGGGGNGGNPGGAGTANTGGGGGGTIQSGTPSGGNGGSGVVIIRYAGSQRGTGGTVTSSGGYTIHTFTTSGTYTA